VVLSAAQLEDKLPPFTEKYDVERVIGRGGMGTVFEARHTRLGQRVAIKVLGEDLRSYPELVRRFEREARAASALSSPHAVRVFDIDAKEDGTPFFVMELLSGRDLNEIIASDGPQPVGLAVRWVIEACDAIAEAHRLGIVHRDIKPSNLLLCETGSIKILDFGIAKSETPNERAITLGVQPLGTPQYMSPEQVRCAKDVDARTDIWSLGVTLYELVTGRPPFNHDLSAACIASIAADPVPDPREFKPELPEDFVKVLMRALEKDPKRRYQTVDELVLALAPFGEAMTPETPSWRVISTIRKAQTPTSGESTLHDEPKPLAPYEPEDTVPPATIIHIAIPHRKRLHGALALAAASLLGFGVFVLTPHWVSTSLDAQQKAAAAATVLVHEPAPPTSASVAAPEEAAPSTSIELPATPRPSTSATAPVIRELPKAPTPRPRPTVVRFVGSERPVHGGISNPGF
jgi:serine/threonine-protein kinase